MTDASATMDRLGILAHLVDHHSTAEQPASYVVEGALDTEIRVRFTCALGTFVGAGKTLDAAALHVSGKVAARDASVPEAAPKLELVAAPEPEAPKSEEATIALVGAPVEKPKRTVIRGGKRS